MQFRACSSLISTFVRRRGEIFLIGSWLRADHRRRLLARGVQPDAAGWPGDELALNLFHIGILGILFDHFFGMLALHWMYEPGCRLK